MKSIFFITLFVFTLTIVLCDEKSDDNEKSDEKLTKALSTEEADMQEFDLMSVIVDCNDTFRVEMSYLEALNKSGSFPDETDRTPKCFIRCVLEKSEVASEDGQFDVERSVEVFSTIRGGIPVDGIKEMATTCSERSETCKCERSYQYLKCLFETEIQKYES